MKENNKCADRPIEDRPPSLIPGRPLRQVLRKKEGKLERKREVNEE